MIRLQRFLFFFVFSLTVLTLIPAETVLDPVDLSSPRSTMRAFMHNMELVRTAFEENAPKKEYTYPAERLTESMDLAEYPQSEREIIGKATAMMMLDILGKVPLADPAMIPGREEIRKDPISVWRYPGTDIELVRKGDSPGTYRYLISALTIERMHVFYERAENLPYLDHGWPNVYETYLNVPGYLMPLNFADRIPVWLTAQSWGNPRWKMLGFGIGVVLLILSALMILKISRRIRLLKDGKIFVQRLSSLFFSVCMAAALLIFKFFLIAVLGLRGESLGTLLLAIAAIFYVLLSLVVVTLMSMLFSVASASVTLKNRGINEHLLKVVFQITSVGLIGFISIRGAEYLGLRIAPLLASLGLGGIAIAIAARPTLENIIGGLTLFADKPVAVGDLCRYGNETGFVEEIGLRSTRVRKLDDTLVSIPNSQFSLMELENQTKRRRYLYKTVLQFRYETSGDQLRYLLVNLREMLLAHPKALHEWLRVRFLGFGSYSLDVELYVNLRATNWPDYLAVREDINFRIMSIVRESGASFAFPSTTAYLGKDEMPDDELRSQAEKKTLKLKEDNNMPFPYHGKEEMRELKGTLDYPPEGSPEYFKKEQKKP